MNTLNNPAEIVYPGGKLSLKRTLIMGILNITPDSFSDGGRFLDCHQAVKQALRMLDDGADIIDIGGESTRPGADPVPLETELERVLPVIESILKKRPEAVISIDTYKSAVARKAIESGARMVNDISGLGFDPEMKNVVRDKHVPVIIMHIKGTPRDMQKNPHYDNLITELIAYFRKRITEALKRGIEKSQIIIDPGIGFGKRLEDNYEILNRLDEFTALGFPVLVGPSRKSFIGRELNLPPEERIFGTAAAVSIAVWKGANILRVHDVKEMVEVIRIVERIKSRSIPPL